MRWATTWRGSSPAISRSIRRSPSSCVASRASAMPERETLAAFAATGATLAIHLAITSLDAIVRELTPFYGADCPAAVVARASWPDEQVWRGTLGDIAAKAGKVERSALVLVGRALAAQDFRDS